MSVPLQKENGILLDLEKKEEFETVVARHNVILKQHMKLEKKKDVCDKARNDYSKLEEERNAKLKVAKIMFEEEKAVLDHKSETGRWG